MAIQALQHLISTLHQQALACRAQAQAQAQANLPAASQAERQAVAQTVTFFNDVLEFPFAELRARETDNATPHQTMPPRRASRLAADQMAMLFQRTLVNSPGEVSRIFKPIQNIPPTPITSSIIRFLEKALLWFKANLQLSELRYYMSRGETEAEAALHSLLGHVTSVAWISRFESLIGQHLAHPDFDGFNEQYAIITRSLRKLEQVIQVILYSNEHHMALPNAEAMPEPAESRRAPQRKLQFNY